MGSKIISFIMFLLIFLSFLELAFSQSPSSTIPSFGSSNSSSVTQTIPFAISSYTSSVTSLSGTQTIVFPTVVNVTLVPLPTSTANLSANATASATPTPIMLNTQLDPAFGVLGGILIITGLPSAFLGHKNRWSSFFLIGFYTLSTACLALILKFGVLAAINPPNQVLRGVFVLACGVAGFAGGGIAIFFWRQTKYFIGAWGGFAVGLWVQCFRDGGLIRPIGLRWILYIVAGVIGFVLCTIPKMHYHILLISTAVVGASAFILGIDCFTAANLKEFYVYNLGFDMLFTTYLNAGIEFPVSQLMEVELGLIGAVAVMGAAVQWRILRVLRYKLKEITAEQKKRDEELEAQASARFAGTIQDLHVWEKEHGRQDSQFSDTPLMKEKDPDTPGTESQHTLVMGERRTRRPSGLSDFLAVPGAVEDESGRPYDKRQSIGVLPAIDLGNDLEEDIPRGFIGNVSDKSESKPAPTAEELDDLKRQEELLAEIQTIRRSIEILRSETPSNSIPSESRNASRHQSFTSRRTLSQDFATVMEGGPSHIRPPRTQAPRARVRSMDGMSALSYGMRLRPSTSEDVLKSPVDRPTSAPLLDEDWDSYVNDRKLFQPPSGVTAPITGTPISPRPRRASQYLNLPNAVSDAVSRRRLQEDLYTGETGPLSPDIVVENNVASHSGRPANPFIRSSDAKEPINRNNDASVTILPPVKSHPDMPTAQKPTPSRVKTFEELTERHRERLHNLQAPITRAEKEEAELRAARNRWERSKEAEKQAMARKEAEKLEKRKSKAVEGRQEKVSSRLLQESNRNSHLLGDQLSRLNNNNASSKRQSLMKVEDWQRYQQNPEAATNQTSKRDSNVPFPLSSSARGPNRSTTVKPGANHDVGSNYNIRS